MKPPLPLRENQKESLKKTDKKRDPIKEYKIVKNKFSIKRKICFVFTIFIPVTNKVIENSIEIKPMD